MLVILLRTLIFFNGLLPLAAARSIGAALGNVTYWLNIPMAKVARFNLQLALPDLGDSEREHLLQRCLQETGKTLMETGITWGLPLDQAMHLITEVENEALFDDAVAQGKGVVLVLLHHGNWEMINHYLYRRQQKFGAIYKPPKNAGLDRWISQSRAQSGLQLYPAGREGAEALNQMLSAGGVVIYAPDQEPGRKSGVFAPLFGTPAFTGTFTGHLVQNNPGAIALCTYVLRHEDGFKVVFAPMPEGLCNPDPSAAAAILNKGIMPHILRQTEQYQWGYKRFRRQPDGRHSRYRSNNTAN